MDALDTLKLNLREHIFEYFSEAELQYLLDKNEGDIDKASYEGLILKAEDTGLAVSGMTTKDTAKYFKMLASHFVKTNSGVLR